mmetsp:Transcript_16551/g.33070  ORF Transcript_16551/g.33070 Transcript_16551/m.33070 type:complete len:96 (+) Transcript_16551:520-807(+)
MDTRRRAKTAPLPTNPYFKSRFSFHLLPGSLLDSSFGITGWTDLFKSASDKVNPLGGVRERAGSLPANWGEAGGEDEELLLSVTTGLWQSTKRHV